MVWRPHLLKLNRRARAMLKNLSTPNCSKLSAMLNKAEGHIQSGQLDTAASIYKQVLDMAPDDPNLNHTLGLVYLELGQTDPALFHIGRSIELHPHNHKFYRSMGDAFGVSQQIVMAIAAYQKAFNINPGDTDTLLNLGIAFHQLDRYSQAQSTFEKIIALSPNHLRALNNLGKVHHDMGQFETALSYYDQCVQLQPCYAEARFNRAALLLAMGDYQRGWQEYEWRFRRSGAANVYPHQLATSRWQGEDFKGRRILVHCEQGMGDVLQFVRYVPQVKQRGGTLIMEAHPLLVSLLEPLDCVDEIITFDPMRPSEISHDLHIPLLSLPAIFGTETDTIPDTVPYIPVPSNDIHDVHRIVKRDHFNIGLVWSSSDLNPKRNLPIDQCVGWFRHPNLHFISLQIGEAEAQIRTMQGNTAPITEWGSQLNNFKDTAAIMAHLDLMISVDTAAAHLAGAMGKPLWTLLPFDADWRWSQFYGGCPWYPTAKMFRQSRSGQWGDVIDDVSAALVSVS